MPERRMSLRAKWTMALLGVGAFPLALFGYTTVDIQRRGLEDAERQLEIAVIDHVSTVLEQTLDEASEATHRVGRVLTEPKVTDDEARLELAREVMARAEVLTQVAIYSPGGDLLDAIERSGAKPAAPPPHVASKGDQPFWNPVELAGDRAWLRYTEPVLRGTERRAWVTGTIDSTALAERLRTISKDRFEDRDDGILLLDDQARILASGSPTLPVGESLVGKDVLAGQHLPTDPFSRPFAFATEFTGAGGEAMVGSVRSLPSRRMAVAVRRSRAAAYGALGSAQRLLGVSMAVFLVAAIALGGWLAARTTRPVRQLVELTRAYARRAFTERSPVRTGDELETLGTSLTDMADSLAASDVEIARRAKVESDLARYLPGEVAKAIAEGKQTLSLGGERRRVSVLFADVVAFTTFAETAPPERAVAMLNELFSVLTEVVFRHGGIVDKFMGDCIMGVFGAPTPMEDHAARALATAEDMHRFVEANAPAWKKTYGADVKLGIGVNTGEVLLGNLGSERRMEYTVIGDVVNVAARLEGLARPGQTLLTVDVANEAKATSGGFETTSLGEQPLRGKRQAVLVLELT